MNGSLGIKNNPLTRFTRSNDRLLHRALVTEQSGQARLDETSSKGQDVERKKERAETIASLENLRDGDNNH